MIKLHPYPSILRLKPTSLTNRRKRRETWKKAKAELRKAKKRWRKDDSTPAHKEMAELSENCTRRNLCGRPWCPQCQHRAQEHIIDECAPALRKFLKEVRVEAQGRGKPRPRVWAVSAVNEDLAVRRGGLQSNMANQTNWLIRNRLDASEELKDAICFLGWDVSMNIQKKRPGLWQVHVYGIMFAETKEQIHKVLDPIFGKPKRKWHKPVKVYPRSPEEIWKTARYALKPNFARREEYVPKHSKNGKPKIKKWKLQAREKDELALFLGDLGFKDRLILRGVKIVSGRLVRTKPLLHGNGDEDSEVTGKRHLDTSPGLFGPTR